MPRVLLLAASVAVLLVAVGTAGSAVPSAVRSSAQWTPTTLGEGAANEINERGQIVGESWSGKPGDAYLWRIPPGCESVRCVNWDTLQRPSWEPDWVWATAINDGVTIVGVAMTEMPETCQKKEGPFCPEADWALQWSSGGKLRLLAPVRKGDNAEALDVNNKGQIVGWSGNRSVVWEKGKPRVLPGGRGKARAINNQGVVAGTVGERAVVWQRGKLRRLGTLGGSKSQAVDINDRGQVIGWSWTKSEKSKDARGFLWDKGKMVDLGAGFAPAALNNRGQIVGSCGKHACVWKNGTLTQLAHGGDEAGANAINERQQIVGYENYRSFNEGHDAVLWTYKP